MTDEQTPGRPPGIIFAACMVLAIVGLGATAISLPGLFDPAGARCHLSRTWLDDANTDDKDWNNVDTGGRKAADLDCPEAIQKAEQVPLRENSDKTIAIPSNTVVQVQSGLAAALGVGQAFAGWTLLRRLTRQARAMAIGLTAAAVILRVLGVISLGVFVFVGYALFFSAASRELWPKAPPPTPDT